MLCVEEQIKQKTPIHRRKEQRLPCPEHGDLNIWPENRIVFSLYEKIQPYHEIRYIKRGESQEPIYFLNLKLVKIFCDELNLEFLDILEKLEIVHSEIDGRNQ
jgi:hypothetical protein